MQRLLRTLLLAAALAACATPSAHRPASVEILRDDWGVPHIYAATEEGGFYGLGYAMAEDRLERLLGGVLLARGELASVIGESQLPTDIAMRQWRSVEMARAGVDRLDPQLHRNYAAFIAGVQAYVADAQLATPLATLAQTLDIADLIALPRALFYLGYHVPTAHAECRVDGMTYSEGMLPYRSANEAPASNGWAIAPARTAAGATIIAADPHVETESAAYYEYHIHAGRLHSAGFALGAALWQAHNEDVAWAMTTGNPDFLDCYAVETDPAHPRRYLYDGAPRDMEVRRETFAVAGGEPVTRELEYTNHNGVLSPVIARRGSVALVASAADMDRAAELSNELYRMNFARSVNDLHQALASMSMLPQNIVAGDRSGRLLYVRAGRAPIRPSGFDWARPVPGNSAATAWRGMHTIDDLVQIRDPAAGYMQNNNAAPDVMTARENIDARAYSADIFHDRPGRQTSRGARTLAWMEAHPAASLDDAIGLMLDETWVNAPDWIAALAYALETRPNALNPSEPVAAAAQRILGFDSQARANSEAAADFYLWRREAAAHIVSFQDGAFIAVPWDHDRFTPAFADLLLTALRDSVAQRRAAYGEGPLQLGDIFFVRRGAVSGPIGGITIDSAAPPLCVERLRSVCERTMRAFGAVAAEDNRFRVIRGSQALRIVQFTTPLRAYSAYAFGQSDDPASPHYADQIALFSERRMKPAYFSHAELANHITQRRVLTFPDGGS